VLDDGESGSDDAGPIVRQIMEHVLFGGLAPVLAPGVEEAMAAW